MNSFLDEHDDALDEFGISGQDETIAISQGSKLTGSIKTVELKLADKALSPHFPDGAFELDSVDSD